MGNEFSSHPGVPAWVHVLGGSEAQAAKHLLGPFPHGDTVLIRCLRTSPTGEAAVKRLESTSEHLKNYWAGLWRASCESVDLTSCLCEPPEVMWRNLLDKQNKEGETALFVAAHLGYAEAVTWLLGQGANPWIPNGRSSFTPLHNACLQGKAASVKILLTEVPTRFTVHNDIRYVDCTTASGLTPLHCAMGSGDKRTLRVVLAHSPQLDRLTTGDSWDAYKMEFPAGTSALHVAAFKGNTVMAKELLRYHHILNTDGVSEPTSDMRQIQNSQNELPWQVAWRMHIRTLAEILHPEFPLTVIFPDLAMCPSLQALASAALRRGLLSALDAVQEQHMMRHVPRKRKTSERSSNSTKPSAAVAAAAAVPPLRQRAPLSAALLDCDLSSDIPLSCEAPICPEGNNCAVQSDVLVRHDVDLSSGVRSCEAIRRHPRTPPPNGAQVARKPLTTMSATLASTAARRFSNLGDEHEGDGVGLFERQVSLCNICMESSAWVQLAPCSHRVCVGCAKSMVQRMRGKPVDCPYCRGHIAGVAAVSMLHA